MTAPEPPATFPWPPAPDASILDALALTWRTSVFSPARFFRAMPVPGPVGPALLYLLIVGVPAFGIQLFWRLVFRLAASGGDRWTTVADGAGMQADPWAPLVGFLLSPLLLLVGVTVAAAVIHAVLWIVGGARGGFATTLRVLCYSHGPALFAVFPIFGPVVGLVWMVVLQVVGLREAHRTDRWRAVLAVLVPWAVLLVGTVLFTIATMLATTRLA